MTEIEITGKVHEIKCWPDHFEAIVDGRKTFDVRRNDRGYQPGDVLRLQEWDQVAQAYTGRHETAIVTYVYHGGGDGVPVPIVEAVGVQAETWGLDNEVVVLGLSVGGLEI